MITPEIFSILIPSGFHTKETLSEKFVLGDPAGHLLLL
jgi:hypothetical protein